VIWLVTVLPVITVILCIQGGMVLWWLLDTYVGGGTYPFSWRLPVWPPAYFRWVQGRCIS
jgi:hypothetical protein